MGKLCADALRYLSRSDIRVLTAVEMGMKNHEVVPASLISVIAKLNASFSYKILKELSQKRLICFEKGKKFEGYRLTNSGYDFLALHTFISRDVICLFGSQIGVGKESDVYVVANKDHKKFALKFHRLGRTSFRKIFEKRDYLAGRTAYSWLYLSRIAASKEYTFLSALYKHGFSVPTPIDFNRHAILMELLCDAVPLNQIASLEEALIPQTYKKAMQMITRLAQHGLIHGDFNEFNLMYGPEPAQLTMIDFPQMVSTSHINAKCRDDDDGTAWKRFKFEVVEDDDEDLDLDQIVRTVPLDVELRSSGFRFQDEQDTAGSSSEDEENSSPSSYETSADEEESEDTFPENRRRKDEKTKEERQRGEMAILNEKFDTLSTTSTLIDPKVIRDRVKKDLAKKLRNQAQKHAIKKSRTCHVNKSRRDLNADVLDAKDALDL